MDQDSDSANGSAVDKSRVLDIKPLRSLVPVFSQSPSGPFSPGISPFYPFGGPPEVNPRTLYANSTPISNAVPINSFRTPQSAPYSGASNGGTGSSRRSSRSRAQIVDDDEYIESQYQKRARGKQETDLASNDDADLLVNNILASYNLMEIDNLQREDGEKELVGYILFLFDLLRRKVSQLEDSKEGSPGTARRHDLRAGAALMNKGYRTNIKKRIGAMPGVEVGDIFFFRMEMCVIGLHTPSMAGIDYLSVKFNLEEEPLAVSIVSSGGYEDNDEDENVLIYTGQGGVSRKDGELVDQKLERGNLALEKSLHRGNEVRVIRGVKDVANPLAKVYVYDGLYKIQESWVEKGKSGANIFKYKLIRLPGQPEAFKIWKSIQQWKDGIVPRFGTILPDLTSGAEPLPVSLVNDLDNEKGPAYFTYSSILKYPKPVNVMEPFVGCACNRGCLPSNPNCSCIQKNGGYLPYIVNGVLVDKKPLIYECGTSCHCPPNCRNRVSQGGLKVRLEVFKTQDKGWGLRSWDPIRAGCFICEYAGEVINQNGQYLVGEYEDDHVFYGNRIYQPVESLPGDSNNAPNLPFPIIIGAKDAGNVARFMNHSCSPNVFWQPVLRANNENIDLHIVFHAIRHVPPMTELTYDYGIVPVDKEGQGKKKCLCGSPKCRGFFY